jgi:hypothetical protein
MSRSRRDNSIIWVLYMTSQVAAVYAIMILSAGGLSAVEKNLLNSEYDYFLRSTTTVDNNNRASVVSILFLVNSHIPVPSPRGIYDC